MAKAKNLEKLREWWDEDYRDIPFEKLDWETNNPDKEAVRLVKEKKIKGRKILDIGCGSGTQAIFFAKNGFDVTGIDIAPSAIKIAKERAEKENVKIKFQTGVSFDLHLKDNDFDFVWDRGCFHHCPPEMIEKFVKEVYRVLKKNGIYYQQSFSDKMPWKIENVFSLKRVKEYFGKYFRVLEKDEIVHIEPQGRKVILNSILMKKIKPD